MLPNRNPTKQITKIGRKLIFLYNIVTRTNHEPQKNAVENTSMTWDTKRVDLNLRSCKKEKRTVSQSGGTETAAANFFDEKKI